MKKREANFELLRIVAMLMIITLHYLDKGGILPKADGAFGVTGFLAWGLEAFCISAVNVYVLISAYFLSERNYQPMKAVRLWLQVVFYSVGIAVILVVLGIVPLARMDKYKLLGYVFPVIHEHYWFVTAYVLMFLLAPLMNDTLRALDKKSYRRGLVLLLVLLSISKSILPVKLPTDRLGYDTLWFMCLYLIGAYIRYHVSIEKINGKKAAAGYLLCSVLIFGSFVVVHLFYQKTGSLVDFINRQYHYNSIFCLLASVCLFLAFRTIWISSERVSDFICRAASASFGVYLIHEHMELRYIWPKWLGTERFMNTPLFLLHWIVSICIVYAVCMLIDFVRGFLFDKIENRGNL